MKISAVLSIATLALSVYSAAVDLEPRKTCTAVWTGVNEEGGGGPGQEPINQTFWSIDITGGGKEFSASLEQTGDLGVVDRKIKAKAFGGKHKIKTHAVWNYGTIEWNWCSVTDLAIGLTYKGTVKKAVISSNIVSTITDKCVVHFPC